MAAQDLAVVVLLMLIPLLAPSESGVPTGFSTIARALGIAAVKVRPPLPRGVRPVEGNLWCYPSPTAGCDCSQAVAADVAGQGVHACSLPCSMLLTPPPSCEQAAAMGML